uniref:Cytochrome b5 heme-binding domain-containing protein n=1 Tax=Rhizochromulina marina TaxID=1034831 RepID=A0A7S2S150_9STRA|mmetsp:Transcript_23498/g.68684  ORF Transcript_23498/g.68684 Transcript_23498/m.68684 type:complete len:499 (+) Transcript_23498:137-1633(+)
MSWGRGVNNNVAGELRMPNVPEHAAARKHREAAAAAPSARLVVRSADTFLPADVSATTNYAYVDEESPLAAGLVSTLQREGRCYIYAHDHPHFVLRLATRKGLPSDAVVLSEVQRFNSHVCEGEFYQWTVFTPWREERPLRELLLEVRPRFPPSPSPVSLGAPALAQACAKNLFGLVVTVNELFLVEIGGLEVVARLVDVWVAEDNPLEAGAEDGGQPNAQDEDDLTFPDYFRGVVDVESMIYLKVDHSARDTMHLMDLVQRAEAPPATDVVDVTTADDEYFPVKKKLLRPCIALTSAVMAGKGVHEAARAAATVPTIDCCTFDRVLLFLEAMIKGRGFNIQPEHLEDMASAADALQLSGLQDLCAKKRGAFQSRVRKEPIPFDEVTDRNSKGEVILVMDGMVLDVTRWLKEHPGGSTIIPGQALNMDSTVFFEIYHVSRQSFLYLKEFYIGELRTEDLARVPSGAGEPSPGFLEQLRLFTNWRLKFDSSALAAHKSF